MIMHDYMREVVQYALEESRNQGLEEAARLLDCRSDTARKIRQMKRDPALKLSDWWSKQVADYAPMGA
jgi:hypothetical protein